MLPRQTLPGFQASFRARTGLPPPSCGWLPSTQTSLPIPTSRTMLNSTVLRTALAASASERTMSMARRHFCIWGRRRNSPRSCAGVKAGALLGHSQNTSRYRHEVRRARSIQGVPSRLRVELFNEQASWRADAKVLHVLFFDIENIKKEHNGTVGGDEFRDVIFHEFLESIGKF